MNRGKQTSLDRWRVPVGVPPIVSKFFDLLYRSEMSKCGVSVRAGLGINVVDDWSRRTVPNIINFEAALNVLGYRLDIVPLNPANQGEHHDP
jgi:hypothetical protein